MARMASWTAAADSPPLPARASRAPLVLERTELRMARLRRRRFSFCLIRFRAERVLATTTLLSRLSDTRAYRPRARESRSRMARMSEPARDATGGHEHVQRGVVGAVGAIGLATLTSRVLGYVR